MSHIDTLKSFDAIMESIKILQSNLNRLSESSDKILERIRILENDFQERSFKKRFFKSLLTFYPFIMILLIWTIGNDHQKIRQAVQDFNSLTQDLKSLTSYAEKKEFIHEEYFVALNEFYKDPDIHPTSQKMYV